MADDGISPEPAFRRGPPPPRRPPAPPAAAPGRPDYSARRAWETLILSGKERGYVAQDEIGRVFEVLEQAPPMQLEPVFALLRSMGIGVVPPASGTAPSQG
ncbi:MAG: hypothetical protein JF887_14185 [Candidatus Dormibacteraeota bacterium]|uniref:RNA polymerase sigma factor 70 region 1.1 domain-containing protein n=1 Tax=Candidatus Amunia macphersoniae TaxID=3127014 RepID=A0A934NK04_9BACT|nr:hypothetical protein [Candidatus Dormibacteraeota bacterium]